MAEPGNQEKTTAHFWNWLCELGKGLRPFHRFALILSGLILLAMTFLYKESPDVSWHLTIVLLAIVAISAVVYVVELLWCGRGGKDIWKATETLDEFFDHMESTEETSRRRARGAGRVAKALRYDVNSFDAQLKRLREAVKNLS